ncbi:peptidylprolyl isomerase [Marinithermus hydrothermalis]|uniref:peptidylprolyl isomerase n=1 Tax=Marinithermus hydrothermalis (strain DSM 14884 / JCM 11576 / T1) TaxID=869210 RepID=F2NNG1_MARHT|nr:peptidylprolyl isomerase [Marinithermus hydrothermalis]AEB10771.1 PpiC-type peptidyl-prolyl cis-trans isomerase [Marinithermus hydrothermalis DSM 14884]
MRVSKRAITVIFGILAVAFALGTIFLFTPQGNPQQEGRTVLWVNGEPVRELELARLQQTTPLFALNPEGALKPLIDTYFLEQVILLKALAQDAARVRVSNSKVRQQVDQIRERFGLETRQDYSDFLQQIGYTDATLRDEIRTQLRINKRLEQIREQVELSEEEARFYFTLHKDTYRTEDRIKARQIVVDDEALARELRERTLAGEEFAALAREYSKVAAEQGGAVGAEAGSDEPQPVTRIVFPKPVADAAFALKEGGLTDVIEAGGRYHLVQVEAFLPGGDASFEEVADAVRADALAAKQRQAVEDYLEAVRARATVKFADLNLFQYVNPVVATVNGEEIPLRKVAELVFSDQQVPQLIQQGLGQLAVQFFFPASLDQLIARTLLLQEAEKSGQPFVGTQEERARDVRLWKTLDVTVSEEEVRTFYNENPQRFVIPASAQVKAVTFQDKESAETFRARLIEGEALEDLAQELGGEVVDYGTVNPRQLPPVLDQLIFFSEATFAESPEGKVSELIELEDGTFQVALVNDQKPEVLRPFEEVQDEARALALAQKRNRIANEWLDELRENAQIENRLTEVLAELAPPAEEANESNGEGETAPAPSSEEPAETQP